MTFCYPECSRDVAANREVGLEGQRSGVDKRMLGLTAHSAIG